MENHDLNYNVTGAKGAKVHYGFHVQGESKEDAEATLKDHLTQVVAQLPATTAKAAKAPAAAKAGKTAAAAPADAAAAAKEKRNAQARARRAAKAK